MMAANLETPAIETNDSDELVPAVVQCVAEGRPLREVFGIDPAYLDGVERKAFELYRDGQYDRAKMLAEGVNALDEERYYPYLLLGDVDLHDGRPEVAREKFERAHELRTDDPCIMFKLAESLLRCGDERRGRRMLEKIGRVADEDDRFHARAKTLLKVLGD